MQLINKTLLAVTTLWVACTAFAGPAVSDWQPDIKKNQVQLNTSADVVLLDATALHVASKWDTLGKMEFGIYSFKRQNKQLVVQDTLALIDPVMTGATGAIEFDLLAGIATNVTGDTAAIGNRFGWYISNGFSTRYSQPTLNNFGFDYLAINKRQSDGDADLFWEMYFANCDEWFDDLIVQVDFSIPTIVAVSEPKTLGLLLAAMASLLYFRRRKGAALGNL